MDIEDSVTQVEAELHALSNDELGFILSVCRDILLARGVDPEAFSDFGDAEEDIDNLELINYIHNTESVIDSMYEPNEVMQEIELFEECIDCYERETLTVKGI